MAAFMEQVADGIDWSTNDVHCAGAQHEQLLVRRSENLERVMGLVPRHQRIAMLSRMVEAEILPRLAAGKRSPKTAHGRAASAGTGRVAAPVLTTKDDTLKLVRLLLNNDAPACVAFMETLKQRGATPASLYLGIICDAARCLGALWDDDRCHFAEVTISMGRLQQVVRALSPDFQAAALSRAHADSILLLPTPGEQHSFGLVILWEFFLREGWHVVGGPLSSRNDAADIVRSTWVDVAGFSIGSSARVHALATSIHEVRAASVNREIKVIVGGPLLQAQPGLAKDAGADASAVDAPDALRQARGLLSVRTVTF
jgi:MerR family transcriptional regulator, light-induced transcriptional regulator